MAKAKKMAKKPMAKTMKLPEVKPQPVIPSDPLKKKIAPMTKKMMKKSKKGC